MFNTITSDNLNKTGQLTIPSQSPDLTPYTAIIDGAITSLPKIQQDVDTATNTQNNLLNTLTTRMTDLSGKTAYQQEQERLAGVDTETAQLDQYNARANDLIASLTGLSNEAKAIPLVMQEQVKGQGVTDAGLAPLTTSKLRENAIKALTLSAEGDALASRIANSETRLQRAKEKASQAVDLKYKPMEEDIARIKTFLEINQKYILDPAEKKRVEATNLALAERERVLQDKKEQDKRIEDIIINGASQGAPQSALNTARKLQQSGAKSSDVAIALGQYAGDYYKTELLKSQIKTEKAQQAKYYADIARANREAVVETQKVTKENQAKITLLTDKIKNINNLSTSSYLSGAVGANAFGRLSPLSFFTGGKQNFIAGVDQLTNNETLDTLINLKSRGGTLGALSDSENKMLRDSATKINSWRMTDESGKTTGYNAGEQDFKDELATLETLAKRAVINAGGVDALSPISANTQTYLDKTVLPSVNFMNTANSNSTVVVSGYASQFNRK